MIHKPAMTIIASDADYNELIAEIYYDGAFVALINQDAGPNNLILEFANANSFPAPCRSVELDWFMNALERAKDRLIRRS